MKLLFNYLLRNNFPALFFLATDSMLIAIILNYLIKKYFRPLMSSLIVHNIINCKQAAEGIIFLVSYESKYYCCF